MHRKVAGAVVVALAFALAGVTGCGSGDEPLTKAEFVRQTNAACKAQPPKASTTSRTRGPEGFLTQVLAQQQLIIDGLDGINAPDELDSDFTKLKDAMGQRLEIVERAVAAVKADPKAKLEDFGKDAEGIQKTITSSARALGLRSCT